MEGREGSDAPAELLLRRLGHHLGGPGGLPDDVHVGLLDPRELLKLPLHVMLDVRGRGAAGRREGHPDLDLARAVADLDVVDETQVVDVDRDLRVVALLEHGHDLVACRHLGTSLYRERRPRRILRFSLAAGLKGPPTREAALEGGPMGDPGLPPLPAQVDDAPAPPAPPGPGAPRATRPRPSTTPHPRGGPGSPGPGRGGGPSSGTRPPGAGPRRPPPQA